MKGFPWLRGFPLPSLGISDSSRPEEIHSHGLKGRTVPHCRESSDPDSLDPCGPGITGGLCPVQDLPQSFQVFFPIGIDVKYLYLSMPLHMM